MASAPTAIRIRAYDVGFGDCFLLTFVYPGSEKHVLIDFGSFPAPTRPGAGNKLKIADHIAAACGHKLTAVVATHRHADHINGFTTNTAGTASGDVIRACQPDVVIQPWTEDPDIDPDATGPQSVAPNVRYVANLRDMQRFHAAMLDWIASAPPALRGATRELRFLGENNIKNPLAVKNLMTMAKTKTGQKYVRYGSSAGLSSRLPGVKVRVLGPPTIDQSPGIETERTHDDDEFWHILAATGDARAARGGAIFDPRFRTRGAMPSYARWLVAQTDALLRQQLLGIVRRMDDAMNNTSVILLFEVGGKKLLFPGDAQIENWSFALGKPSVRALLAGVDVYKVGHHGSLNATPRTSLWSRFTKKGTPTSGLTTLLSTESKHHGHTQSHTEVPRETLVTALQQESKLFSTETSPLTKENGVAFFECTLDLT